MAAAAIPLGIGWGIAMAFSPLCGLAVPLLSAVAAAITVGTARLSPWRRIAGRLLPRLASRRDAALLQRLARLCRAGEDDRSRQDRIAALVGFLADAAGLDRLDQSGLRTGATLYRIGDVLQPPGTDAAAARQLAPEIAARLLAGKTAVHRIAVDMARAHGENWDGSGTPCGLAGGAIPFSARLLKVGLALDALLAHASQQPGRASLPAIAGCIASEGGRTLDPELAMLPMRDIGRLERLLSSSPFVSDRPCSPASLALHEIDLPRRCRANAPMSQAGGLTPA